VLLTAVLGTALAMSLHYRTAKRRLSSAALPQARVSHASSNLRAVDLAPQNLKQGAPESHPVAANPEREQAKATPLPAPLPAPIAVRRRHSSVDLSEFSSDEPAKAEERLPAVDVTESTAARAAAAPAEEASLVLAGLRLLRRDHDPAQAGVLFGRYLERFPQGALVQEALALAIEASAAKGDGRSAAGLAEQYLARFPTGRFSRLAHKVVGPRP
jgi:TolA-binding protein